MTNWPWPSTNLKTFSLALLQVSQPLQQKREVMCCLLTNLVLFSLILILVWPQTGGQPSLVRQQHSSFRLFPDKADAESSLSLWWTELSTIYPINEVVCYLYAPLRSFIIALFQFGHKHTVWNWWTAFTRTTTTFLLPPFCHFCPWHFPWFGIHYISHFFSTNKIQFDHKHCLKLVDTGQPSHVRQQHSLFRLFSP